MLYILKNCFYYVLLLHAAFSMILPRIFLVIPFLYSFFEAPQYYFTPIFSPHAQQKSSDSPIGVSTTFLETQDHHPHEHPHTRKSPQCRLSPPPSQFSSLSSNQIKHCHIISIFAPHLLSSSQLIIFAQARAPQHSTTVVTLVNF